MTAASTLEYGRVPRHRRKKWYLAVLLLALFASVWYFRAPLRSFAVARYQLWQFTRAFDRVGRALDLESGLWDASKSDVAADQHLRALLALSPNGVAMYRGDHENTVVFVRAGQIGNQRWLAFACMSVSGLDVFTFVRDDPRAAGHHRPYETRQFWSYLRDREGSLTIDVGEVTQHPDHVRTVVTINGGRNVIDWTITPETMITNPAGIKRLVTAAVAPQTGWLGSRKWWPQTGGWRFVNGPGPAREIPAVVEGLALAFVGEDRIALATSKRVTLTQIETGEFVTHELPGNHRLREIAVFSPDGTKCFVGGSSAPELFIDSLSGRVQAIGESYGAAHASWPDNDTLVLVDNTRHRQVDCVTGTTKSVRPANMGNASVAAGLIAYTSVEPLVVHLATLDRAWRGTVTGIQGLHQLSLSPDGRWLALKGQSGFSIFEVSSSRAVLEHDMDHGLHTARSRIKWSADGLRGACAGSRYVYVWSLAEPRWVARFPHGRLGYWPDVALSADGKRLAVSAAESSSIGYWPDVEAAVKGE